MKVKIAAVQFETTNDWKYNLKKVNEFFKKAKGCDIICFPESFLTGSEDLSTFNPKIEEIAKKTFSKLSIKYKIYSIMGTINEKKGDKLINVSYLFGRNGKIIGSYIKKSLVPKTEEMRDFTKGKETPIFKTDFGIIGINICRDLFHPKITKELKKKGAEIIFCPSFWSYTSSWYLDEMRKKYNFNTEARIVDALVPARCFETCTPIIFINCAGNFVNELGYDYLLGRTQASIPFYGTIKKLKHRREDIMIFEIDKDITKDARKAYSL